jgi:hypothetical protein
VLETNKIDSQLILFTVLLNNIDFQLSISPDIDEFTLRGTFMADTLSDDLYLFLFNPESDASDDHLTIFVPPASETHYWSFDPQGCTRISDENAEDLGLPRVNFLPYAYGPQWSQRNYDLLAEFHRAKGYDPYSQAVAIELGYPLIDVDELHHIINSGRVRLPVPPRFDY